MGLVLLLKVDMLEVEDLAVVVGVCDGVVDLGVVLGTVSLLLSEDGVVLCSVLGNVGDVETAVESNVDDLVGEVETRGRGVVEANVDDTGVRETGINGLGVDERVVGVDILGVEERGEVGAPDMAVDAVEVEESLTGVVDNVDMLKRREVVAEVDILEVGIMDDVVVCRVVVNGLTVDKIVA